MPNSNQTSSSTSHHHHSKPIQPIVRQVGFTLTKEDNNGNSNSNSTTNNNNNTNNNNTNNNTNNKRSSSSSSTSASHHHHRANSKTKNEENSSKTAYDSSDAKIPASNSESAFGSVLNYVAGYSEIEKSLSPTKQLLQRLRTGGEGNTNDDTVEVIKEDEKISTPPPATTTTDNNTAPDTAPKTSTKEEDENKKKRVKAEEKERRRQEHLQRLKEEGTLEKKQSMKIGGSENDTNNTNNNNKSTTTKAERRAQQEAQRALKESVSKEKGNNKNGQQSKETSKESTTTMPTKEKAHNNNNNANNNNNNNNNQSEKDETHRSFMDVRTKTRKDSHFCERHFSHLNLHQTSTSSNKIDSDSIEFQYPCVERLAEAYRTRKCVGSTNRVRQLLLCLKEVVQAYNHASSSTTTTTTGSAAGSYSQALLVLVNHVISRIQEARPISTSMGNAVKSLKLHLTLLSQAEKLKETGHQETNHTLMTVEAQKKKTLELLDGILTQNVEKAVETIVQTLSKYFIDGNVEHVVTYGHSESVVKSLIHAKESGYENMCVSIIDAAPAFEGRETLKLLLDADISCEYTLIHGMDVVFQRQINNDDKSKMVCLIGASAVLANGKIMSRAGSASFCNAAKYRGIKVLVAAETIKFHERVGIDSVLHNDIQNFIIEPGSLANLRKLCVSYDHVDDIDEIVCERGFIDPSKVTNYIG
jgi:translation initiation factor eIF-2B subunit delta